MKAKAWASGEAEGVSTRLPGEAVPAFAVGGGGVSWRNRDMWLRWGGLWDVSAKVVSASSRELRKSFLQHIN